MSDRLRPVFARLQSNFRFPAPPVTFSSSNNDDALTSSSDAILELNDGSAFRGISFGAQDKSVSGECVFQTGSVHVRCSMLSYSNLSPPRYGRLHRIFDRSFLRRPDPHSHISVNWELWSARTPKNDVDLPLNFESSRIHIAALVVGSYTEDHSHFLANSSLGAWLKENNVPAICGVDTRALTKKIREKGSMLAKVLARKPDALPQPLVPESRSGSRSSSPPAVASWEDYIDIPWHDPNADNLVATVSIATPRVFKPTGQPRLHPSGRVLRIVAVDVGMKYNQIRCFTERGVELKVVPWDYDFVNEAEPYDGLFISNGPGNPVTIMSTVSRLAQAMKKGDRPIFGICLGHQLLALAAGATRSKMKYGNRGQNIPCTDALSGRCYITCQNHGFQVNRDTLPQGWKELFRNAVFQ
jgi:carbamoyl-phosphate synthase/aspartate carbamoyltransferase